MIFLLMRYSKDACTEAVFDSFMAIKQAHPDALVLSGKHAVYTEYLRLAASVGLSTCELQTEIYDPRVLFGANKANWILDERSPRAGCNSLHSLYHMLSIEIESVLRDSKDRVIVFCLDQLLIEVVYLILISAPISSIRSFSLYLEELSIAVLVEHALDERTFCTLLKSNVKPRDAFRHHPLLKVVK